jgi:hypothetical protein
MGRSECERAGKHELWPCPRVGWSPDLDRYLARGSRPISLERRLATLPGLETITGQIADLIAVLRAEQARRQAGIEIRRPARKNLVFTGGPGTGKFRTARALARLYKGPGPADPRAPHRDRRRGPGRCHPRDTATQVAEAIKPRGALLLITGADTWHDLPDRGQHLLGCLYQQMTAAHRDREGHPGELAIILSGRKDPLHALLAASPRWPPAFPPSSTSPATPRPARQHRHRPGQRSRALPDPGAQRKATAVLAEAEKRHATGNARLAVRLLNQATTQPGPPRHRRIPPS